MGEFLLIQLFPKINTYRQMGGCNPSPTPGRQDPSLFHSQLPWYATCKLYHYIFYISLSCSNFAG